jgi:murein L,D-transpeptidase YafK
MIGLAHAALLAAFVAPVAGGVGLWFDHAPRAAFPPTPLAGTVDHVLIDKSDRRMTLYRDGHPVKSYPVSLGFAPVGAKTMEGDGRTPEGRFRIDRRNPQSSYHLSLGIDYPQSRHRSAARKAGVSPGGDIFIHGQPNVRKGRSDLSGDWTAGCVALTDDQIEEVWGAVPMGASVEIRP